MNKKLISSMSIISLVIGVMATLLIPSPMSVEAQCTFDEKGNPDKGSSNIKYDCDFEDQCDRTGHVVVNPNGKFHSNERFFDCP